MGRKVDPERAALLKKLGLENTRKNWSKSELQEMNKRRAEKEQEAAEREALTTLIAGPPPVSPPAEMEIPYDLRGQEDPFTGLTERQKLIARLRMRGLSQQAIANIVNVAQPIISKELARIKEWQAERGANIDQNEVVGNTASLYEEVEYRAWELFHKTEEVAEKAKALAVVMQAREKNTKLLMDLGLIKKAGQEVKHTIEVSPFLKSWNDEKGKKQLANTIVAGQLTELTEPSPDIEDGEIVEDEDDGSVGVATGEGVRRDSAGGSTKANLEIGDLAEPEPDELDLDD